VSIAILASRAQLGIGAPPVTIEVFLSGGLPRFNVVGMPETAVRESSDRVRGAIINSGLPFPRERITVSLAPADMRKTGGRFDLAIALGILCAQKAIPARSLDDTEFLGELSLNGNLRPVPGVLPAALKADESGKALMVPRENADEAALTRCRVYPAATLLDVIAHLKGARPIAAAPEAGAGPADSAGPDLQDVQGQSRAKRALEIAAAGGHNLLLIGPPGTGKSMLARRLPGILPPMTDREALETAGVNSVLGNRHVLEVLREPLEAGVITISRAAQQADFPARVQLVAAMNPCPCGYLGDARGNCHCSRDRVAGYRSKISGPLLDRIDLRVEVGRPAVEVLRDKGARGEPSTTVRQRVVAARAIALARGGMCNAQLEGEQIEAACEIGDEGLALLDDAIERFALSVRAYHRVLRVSRTIADLAGADAVGTAHVAEALSLRALEQRGTTC
jgi:magnesium chelatase family protein